MFGSTQSRPTTSSFAPRSSDACDGEAEGNFQAPDFPTADLNVVEVTEIEYTQLQQLLYSPIGTISNDGGGEARMNPAFFPSSTFTSTPQYQPTGHTTGGSGGQNVRPFLCQSSNNSLVHANPSFGYVDFEELRMMMLSEPSLAPPRGNMAEKHPTSTSGGDSSGAVPMRWISAGDVIELNKENENLGQMSEPRTKSTVRVRLEDRFNTLPTDVPRCTEVAEAGVTPNKLVTLLCHSSQLRGPQYPGTCTPIEKTKAAQSVYSSNILQSATPSRNTAPSPEQAASSMNCGASCPLLEAAKNQEISLSQGFSFCNQQDIDSAKGNLGPRSKAFLEEASIKVEDTSWKQSIKNRSRLRPADTDMERKVLGDIGNTCQGASWAPTQGNAAGQASDSKQAGVSQRRERHNRMERDRRRRIRVCCDELNILVPFCTMETDKASTLQWTTAFLKYIQERHGDTLKKEFEAVFCGRTGRRLKVALRSGSVPEGSSSQQDVK